MAHCYNNPLQDPHITKRYYYTQPTPQPTALPPLPA